MKTPWMISPYQDDQSNQELMSKALLASPGSQPAQADDAGTGARQRLFIAPEGGGQKLAVDGIEVQIVTPRSPLGDAVTGKRVGDLVELHAGGKVRELSIDAIA